MLIDCLMILNISKIADGTVLTLNVPEITSFELQGGRKEYDDLKLTSIAATTTLKDITIHNCTRIPLEISSETLKPLQSSFMYSATSSMVISLTFDTIMSPSFIEVARTLLYYSFIR